MLLNISAWLAAALLVCSGPEATSARVLTQACGMQGQPVCTGAAMAGRDFECDFGSIGQAGVCVKYTVAAATSSPPANSPCGKLNQPTCKGAQMAGRRTECDWGSMGVAGMCVPYSETATVPTTTVSDTATATGARATTAGTATGINPTVTAQAAVSKCGSVNKPVCKGTDMNGRDSECDFGLVALCTRVTATTREKMCVKFHDKLALFEEDNIAHAECGPL